MDYAVVGLAILAGGLLVGLGWIVLRLLRNQRRMAQDLHRREEQRDAQFRQLQAELREQRGYLATVLGQMGKALDEALQSDGDNGDDDGGLSAEDTQRIRVPFRVINGGSAVVLVVMGLLAVGLGTFTTIVPLHGTPAATPAVSCPARPRLRTPQVPSRKPTSPTLPSAQPAPPPTPPAQVVSEPTRGSTPPFVHGAPSPSTPSIPPVPTGVPPTTQSAPPPPPPAQPPALVDLTVTVLGVTAHVGV